MAIKKYKDYLNESLAASAQTEPSSEAAKEAKKLNLTYVGFGRYSDSTGKVTYTVQNNKLVPYKGKQEVANASANLMAKPDKDPEINKKAAVQINKASKVVNKQQKIDSAMTMQQAQEADQIHNALSQYYNNGLFSSDELSAIQNFVNTSFGPVNSFLYKGIDATQTPDDAQQIGAIVDTLDAAFQGTSAPFDYPTYVGLSDRYDATKLKAGSVYQFRGYASTTLDYHNLLDVYNEVSQDPQAPKTILQLEVQKGQQAIYVSGLTTNKVNNSMETLLPRGAKVEILSGPDMVDSSVLGRDQGLTVALIRGVLIEDV
jgi:hypothetical protein